MARTADLGWPIARCDRMELEILTPSSDGDAANSIRITEWENILRLRDLINEVEADNGVREELEENGA